MALTLACQSLGDGPPLLVLHGLFGSGTNWRSVARALADRHRVHLLDLRNHGRSPHGPAMDYGTLARDVDHTMDALGVGSAAVVGHSMGGKTAMTLALTRPSRVLRLVVVDIAPAPSGQDHSGLVEAMIALPLERLSRRAQADAALARHVPDAALRRFLLQNLRADGDRLGWRIDLAAIRAALEDLLAFPAPAAGVRYPGPALFVRGEHSEYLLDAHAPLVRRWFPEARTVSVAGAGHWVHAERPAAFLEAVAPFLAGEQGP